jgi:hypothetical protein
MFVEKKKKKKNRCNRDANGNAIDAAWLNERRDGLGVIAVRADPSTIVRGRHSLTVRATVQLADGATRSVFVKRCAARELEPVKRGAAKWARDVASYRNEALFLRAVPLVRAANDAGDAARNLGAPEVYAVSTREDDSSEASGAGSDAPPDVAFVTVMAEVPGYQVFYMDRDHATAAITALARQHVALDSSVVDGGKVRAWGFLKIFKKLHL